MERNEMFIRKIMKNLDKLKNDFFCSVSEINCPHECEQHGTQQVIFRLILFLLNVS